MANTYKVVSDIHGMYLPLMKLIKQQDFTKRKEKFVIVGDMIDRGTEIFKVVDTIFQLQKEYSANKIMVTLGNHEYYFLIWLAQNKEFRKNNANPLIKSLPQYSNFIMKYIKVTIENFYTENNINVSQHDIENSYSLFYNHFKEICDWLANLPVWIETKHILFVHGGLDIDKPNFNRQKVNEEFLDYRYWWNSERKTEFKQLIIFGHTPVKNIHGTHDIYFDEKRNIVGIDGGISFGGQLNCITVRKGKIINEEIFN